jgi:hypothetical protein
VPEAAWINQAKTNSSVYEACALAENTLIPRVWGDGSMRDVDPAASWELILSIQPHDRPGTTLNSFGRCLKIIRMFRMIGGRIPPAKSRTVVV